MLNDNFVFINYFINNKLYVVWVGWGSYKPGRGMRLSLAHFLIAIMMNSACEFAVFLNICIISFKLSL